MSISIGILCSTAAAHLCLVGQALELDKPETSFGFSFCMLLSQKKIGGVVERCYHQGHKHVQQRNYNEAVN